MISRFFLIFATLATSTDCLAVSRYSAPRESNASFLRKIKKLRIDRVRVIKDGKQRSCDLVSTQSFFQREFKGNKLHLPTWENLKKDLCEKAQLANRVYEIKKFDFALGWYKGQKSEWTNASTFQETPALKPKPKRRSKPKNKECKTTFGESFPNQVAGC